MTLFLSLYLGHVLGDFVFQPGRLVIAKRKDPRAALLHALIVTACTAAVLAGEFRHLWLAVLLTGVAHLAVEQLSIRARQLENARGLWIFLADQALHAIAIAVICLLPWREFHPLLVIWPVTLPVLSAVTGVVTVAFGGSILVFEILLPSRPASGDSCNEVLRLDGPRLYGFAERGLAFAAVVLLPLPAAGALPFLPRVVYAFTLPRDAGKRQLHIAAIGLAICVVAWALFIITIAGK